MGTEDGLVNSQFEIVRSDKSEPLWAERTRGKNLQRLTEELDGCASQTAFLAEDAARTHAGGRDPG